MKKSIFIFWLVVFGFAATIGFAQSFPDGFQGTWKRAQYASTLTFTRNTVKASNRDVFWTLQRSHGGNQWTIVSSGTAAVLTLTISLVNGNLEIAGDSGSGEGNWNGTWTNILFAAVSFNSQGGSAVAPKTVTKGRTVPYPEEPVKAGAYFDGWYKEARCTNPWDYGAPVSGAVTLYAKWLTEKEMIAAEFDESVPEIFEVNNASAAFSGESGWDSSWAKARLAINTGGDGKNYVIKVTGNFQLAGVSSTTFTPVAIKVLVYAPVNKTISSSSEYSLLDAGKNQTLIIRNITLQGWVLCVDDANAHLIMRPGTVITKNTLTGVRVDGGTFTMSGGVITGNTTQYGGVYVTGGAFTMSGGAISGNKASYGGVYVTGGIFTMDGGTISGNKFSSVYYSDSDGGGGVYVEGGTFTMNGGTLSGNNAGYGGGVYVKGGTFTMGGGAISGNTAFNGYGGGGGVYVEDGTFTMSDGTISNNETSNGNGGNRSTNGGGVYIAGGTFTMDGGAISGNSGGVYVAGGTFTISAGTINGNTATFNGHGGAGNGGGVYAAGGTFTMNGGAISGNTARAEGGGVYVNEKGAFMMSGGTISRNNASDGGGVYFSGSGTFTMNDGSISGNTASGSRDNRGNVNVGNGGGVYFSGGTFTMSSGAISGNTASDGGNGGGVYVGGGTFWLRGGTVYGRGAKTGLANTASSGASLTIKDITFMAKYGDGGDLIESGLATNATLVGHGASPETPSTGATNAAAEAPAFPENFQGTWKRPQYASTLTFTGNTVKASNRNVFWTLRSASGNRWTIVSSGTRAVLALTIRLVNGKLEISGDSGAGEGNWNGAYTNIKPAIPTATSNSQVESAVPPPPAPAPAATNTPAPAEAAQNTPPASQSSVESEKVYKIGDTGPGGGIVFYVERGNSGMEVSKLLGSHTWEEAVKIAKSYDGGGMNDWYLPTQDELALIYVNLHEAGIVNMGAIIYWSSSKQAGLFYVGGPVFCQRFSDGAQGTGDYNEMLSVRAVRVF